jgi:ribonuclease P protein component
LIISSLRNQKAFDLVNRKGVKRQSANFILIIAKRFSDHRGMTPDASSITFGMKVNRKVGNAVIRNKVKRRARHLLRLAAQDLPYNNLGIIFVPRKPFVTADFAVLSTEFKELILSVAGNSKRNSIEQSRL